MGYIRASHQWYAPPDGIYQCDTGGMRRLMGYIRASHRWYAPPDGIYQCKPPVRTYKIFRDKFDDDEIDEEFHIDKDVPIIVMGDFNVDVKRNEKAFGFMKKHFEFNMVPTNYPSTLGN
ncbi:hypothetical protein AVEN_40533-1 [Araneus ventricosus]|uniref:Endonuclease/exonuclease/phosphatase domain-containing protein n=1 Tax=Araneus ventricosus TaxID=182803 RepID=A0A4Y2LY63_ARAVE|nr:hypothetical protein AVEN_40533-1 [Araneus ventricosus]